MSKRIHAFVSGRVQGVFFRSFVRSQANLKNLTGWVRNLPDGRVEIVAEGDSDRIDDFLELVRAGPTGARVESFDVQSEKPVHKFQEFSIR
jgi:acylphosphatase